MQTQKASQHCFFAAIHSISNKTPFKVMKLPVTQVTTVTSGRTASPWMERGRMLYSATHCTCSEKGSVSVCHYSLTLNRLMHYLTNAPPPPPPPTTPPTPPPPSPTNTHTRSPLIFPTRFLSSFSDLLKREIWRGGLNVTDKHKSRQQLISSWQTAPILW